MKSKRKIIARVLILLFIVGGGIFAYIYSIIHSGFDINKTEYIYIDSDKNYHQLVNDLQQIAKVQNIGSFNRVASFMDYPQNMKTGKYAVEPQMSIIDLVRILRRGEQTPAKVTFNNIRTKNDLSTRLSDQLMFAKEELDKFLNEPEAVAIYGFDIQTVLAMFIPNTYEFYWDVSVHNFVSRMNKEYLKFWSDVRLEKAKKLNLSPIEVSTLASIVEEECTFVDEYPVVAGLYINRLRRGQMLQADPTVKFAVGDFGLRRILFAHLETQSPYNTYLHAGLPPGPIRVPSIKGLDAVLNHSEHNFYYMCAKDDFSGRHNFATNLAQHERNANMYRKALNDRQIYK